ncbi:hypothetical protein AB6A40_005675 [Gnathostoma spinigerum]|uniref:Uncharacterized protein n=1 Tax=Gnathostoma spinigerum TaxID=75299 RepID=A0ABD6EGX3_9BILA
MGVKRAILQRQKQAELEIEEIRQKYNAEMFIDQVPLHRKNTMEPIPRSERCKMAQQIADNTIRRLEQEVINRLEYFKQQLRPSKRNA